MGITINFNKAKELAHDKRRLSRSLEFAPLDEIVSKQIPGEVEQAEIKRQAIREKYASIQTQIDEAQTIEELKVTCSSLKEE